VVDVEVDVLALLETAIPSGIVSNENSPTLSLTLRSGRTSTPVATPSIIAGTLVAPVPLCAAPAVSAAASSPSARGARIHLPTIC